MPDASSLDLVMELANRGDWENATYHCEALLAINPADALVHYYHALVQQYAGALDKAEHALRRAVYLDRKFALAHYQLGLIHKEGRDLARSRRAFRNASGALEGLPDHIPVRGGQISAFDLRRLACQQLELLGSHER